MAIVNVSGLDGAIATIGFNKPETRNAYDHEFVRALAAAVDEIEFNSNVSVVILKSEVPGAFCYGADVKAFAGLPPEECSQIAAAANTVFNRLETMDPIVIAAISGVALGGGLEMALACTLRLLLRQIAEDKPTPIGLVETNLGMIPGTGGTQRLPHLIGETRALLYIATGRLINPDDALAWGLVNGVFDTPQTLEEGVNELANELAARPQLAMVATKKAVLAARLPFDVGLQTEKILVDKLFGSEDAREAFMAFAEKRKPAPWTGK